VCTVTLISVFIHAATLEASLQHIIEADVHTDQKYLFPMLEKENNNSDTESDKSDTDDFDDSDKMRSKHYKRETDDLIDNNKTLLK
jgi:hypothetical protein